ncbi:hypothetical protein WN944_005304 [Citrus x changshan-huyou]|uniref:Uncharacterized protein n=1 Tax=Citrus x changshan-huyou TaxID=2935761 RepID=A0AAP0M221_9ROSI
MAAAPTCGGWRRPCGWGQRSTIRCITISAWIAATNTFGGPIQGLALKSVAAKTTTNFKELIAKSQLNINEGTL